MPSTILPPRPVVAPGESLEIVSADSLFRAHSPFVGAFLRRLGVSDDAVDDTVQEVFLVAHLRGGYCPGPASPRTWLGAIAIRVAANSRRSRQRRRETHDEQALEHHPASDAPDMLVEQREELAHAGRALGEMSPVHREVLLRFAVAGHSCDDIARSTGVPTGTVYSRLHAARNSFSVACASLASAA